MSDISSSDSTTSEAPGLENKIPDSVRARALSKARSWRERRRLRHSLQSRLHRRLVRSVEALVLVIVVVVGAAAGYLVYQLDSISRVNVKLTPASQVGTMNILLLGSTSRCAVAPAKNFENFVKQCQNNVNGVNSDVIMILRLVPNRTPKLLSIPRDTFLPDARSGGLYNKIDAALADGPSQLVDAIQQDLGIPINHFVVLNFETFANIVTALGGITMYFPTALKDQQSGLLISHSGCLHISGLEALALVRARHLQYDYNRRTHQWLGYDGSGDIGRIERVHIFMKVLGEEVAKRGLSNPATDNALLTTIAPDLTLDTSFGDREIIDLLLGYHSKIAATRDMTLPVVEDTSIYDYKGFNYGYVVFPTQPEDQSTIDSFMGGTPLGARVHSGSITVSVISASGDSRSGAAVASGLRSLGFRAKVAGSQSPVGSVVETTVYYADHAHLADAERVLRSLSGLAVLAQGATVNHADVTVIAGTNLSVASTGTPITSSTRPDSPAMEILTAFLSSMTASTTPTTPTNPTLANPTPSAPSIAPYDPRACPAK